LETLMRRLFLAGLMLLAGCSGSTGPKMAELSELPASISVRTLWQASVGEAGDAICFPLWRRTASTPRPRTVPSRASKPRPGRRSWPGRIGRTLSGGVGSDGTSCGRMTVMIPRPWSRRSESGAPGTVLGRGVDAVLRQSGKQYGISRLADARLPQRAHRYARGQLRQLGHLRPVEPSSRRAASGRREKAAASAVSKRLELESQRIAQRSRFGLFQRGLVGGSGLGAFLLRNENIPA